MEEPKKISFGFSKSSKQPKPKFNKPVDLNIQYIDCLDDKSIKIKGSEVKSEDIDIVIPLSTATHKKDNKLIAIIKSVRANDDNEGVLTDCQTDLDSIAARELIAEARKSHIEEKEDRSTIELLQDGRGTVDGESTLDDYEAVPISKYGAAMLRGMGWEPTKGIGKNGKVVASLEPKVRPRGMGLGVVLEKSSVPSNKAVSISKPEEELKIVKGAYMQVTSGPHKDLYGQIEGFNEETGRMILKLTLGGSSLSMNEYMVTPVSKDEFVKNSRVLNVSKYKEYKSNESKGSHRQENGSSHSKDERKKREGRTREEARSRSRSPSRKYGYKKNN